jgi:hypothetical protein
VWLLSEWPRDEPGPTKYYLSSLPATTSLRTLVWFGKLRWRIERDYQELKGELGLDHFEGRTWNGFYHQLSDLAGLEMAERVPDEPGALFVVGAIESDQVEVRVEPEIGRSSLYHGDGAGLGAAPTLLSPTVGVEHRGAGREGLDVGLVDREHRDEAVRGRGQRVSALLLLAKVDARVRVPSALSKDLREPS